MLADALADLRSTQSNESSSLSARLSSLAANVVEGRRSDAQDRDRLISASSRASESLAISATEAAAVASSKVAQVEETFSERGRAAAADARSAAAAAASLEASVGQRINDLTRRLEEAGRATSGRLDAFSSALHAFANVLNLGSMVVDPKAVLKRSFVESGIGGGGGGGGGSFSTAEAD